MTEDCNDHDNNCFNRTNELIMVTKTITSTTNKYKKTTSTRITAKTSIGKQITRRRTKQE